MRPFIPTAVAVALTGGAAVAQVTGVATPGMPPGATLGMDQTDRFANDFNPGIGFVFDLVGGYYDLGAGDASGFDLDVRTLEMTPAGYVDPSTWGWATVVWVPEEGVALEEATIVYAGTPLNTSLRAGKFFIDFGKQMQAHVHDLRTVDRPLVLRDYLGFEAPGTGIQWDQWFSAGDATAIRYSFGVLPRLGGNFEGEPHEHGAAGPDPGGPEAALPVQKDFKDLNELNYSARLTGYSELSAAHTLQYGGSGRFVPDYALTSDEAGVAPVTGLSNAVWGLDLSYGWQNRTGTKDVQAGLEWLWNTGDLGGFLEAQPDGTESIAVVDGTATGYYVWAEYGWFGKRQHNVGVQWSRAQLVQPGLPRADEYDVYFTWNVTELNRIRFALTMNDPEAGNRSYRLAVQLTAFLGPHAHGVNW